MEAFVHRGEGKLRHVIGIGPHKPLIHATFHDIDTLDAGQKQALTAIANKCPVHKILSGRIRINIEEE